MSGGRIPREFIDDLLVRVDIVDLIDSQVPLKKTGANYVARCPFHTEKTPSFSVNRQKQFFHCFGCGASGNAIGFLMDYRHLEFVEAVEDLADFVGVEVPREAAAYQASPSKDNLTDLYALTEKVAAFYVEQLRSSEGGKKAVDYLKARGLSSDCAREFMLGYAPDEWQSLPNLFDERLLLEAGLLVAKENGRVYDRFRQRIMFPIRDKRGRVVGFGGRVLDDSLPKYLNSPETSLFHKGKLVYGLFELLQKHAKPPRILIVEGYMDVISLAQFGIDYAVAVLGTAATAAHLDLLFRFSSELVFCFDGDRAGREAAWRVMESVFPSLKEGKQVRIMLLPQSFDPDSLVRHEGLEAFVGRVQGAQTLSDYFFEHIAAEFNLKETEGRAQFVAKAKPYLDKLPEGVFKELMFARLKNLSGSPRRGFLETQINQKLETSKLRQPQDKARLSSARVALALLLQNPLLIAVVEAKKIAWDKLEFSGGELFKGIVQVLMDEKPANTAVLLEYYRDKPEEKTIKALVFLDLSIADERVTAVFNDALDKLLNQAKEMRLDKLLLKEKDVGLDESEKILLRELLSK
ncbi:DNA primase [Methylosoma difficile]